METCSLRQRGVAVQPLPCDAVIAYAIVGLSRPAEITTSLTTSGVTEFCSYGVLIGTSHSNRPSSAATPTSLACDCVMICRVPAIVARIGEAYAGPSPVHRHLRAPVAASIAVSAPAPVPPRNTITLAPSAIG